MAIVVDTNVWVAASGLTDQADAQCTLSCQDALENLRHADVLALDDQHRIESEYFSNLPNQSYGSSLLRTLLAAGRVDVRTCQWSAHGTALVPEALEELDPSDRKFAAIALACVPTALILNALDSDWRDCRDALVAVGLEVNQLCPQCLR